MITALAGGVGASKLLDGFNRAMSPEQLSIIVNTGDDIEMFGLYIAPDLDIVSYTLAGLVNPDLGWGVNSDSFYCLDLLLRYTEAKRWFNLGDRDLATHIFRTHRLKQGDKLSEITDQIRLTLGVKSKILPMTDTHTPTTILTDNGEMHFQEYLVKHLAQPVVKGIRFENIETAEPAPGVAEAILNTDAVVICPSNPLISIGPILAVPRMRDLIKQTSAKVVVVSSVVDGASLKGPTDQMLRDLGMEVSALQIAKLYEDIADVFVLDQRDEVLRPEIEELGLQVVVTDTVMRDADKKRQLAETILTALSA
ncbi:MAG: 2-phospho-L-lactate transferase [Acidobacteriota bacterium]|nr:2-phospho-L-lactate transferase [Acidobacteriota bacterium]